MQKEMRERKKASQFKKFVPGAKSGMDAVEAMNQSYGGNATNFAEKLLNDKNKVTERDKVSFIAILILIRTVFFQVIVTYVRMS